MPAWSGTCNVAWAPGELWEGQRQYCYCHGTMRNCWRSARGCPPCRFGRSDSPKRGGRGDVRMCCCFPLRQRLQHCSPSRRFLVPAAQQRPEHEMCWNLIKIFSTLAKKRYWLDTRRRYQWNSCSDSSPVLLRMWGVVTPPTRPTAKTSAARSAQHPSSHGWFESR